MTLPRAPPKTCRRVERDGPLGAVRVEAAAKRAEETDAAVVPVLFRMRGERAQVVPVDGGKCDEKR